MTIYEWTNQASKQLTSAGIPTAKLDTELILSHTLRKPRTWLHAHADEEMSERHEQIADSRLALRLDRVPLAYIIGHKEFYGRRFDVSPQVLIPRPESEQMIELLLEVVPQTTSLPGTSAKKLVDIGTGSGALGITAKLERPELAVTLLDTSRPALAVAEKNARTLKATVDTMQSNLLDNYPFAPEIVLANLPYVSTDWERSPETAHEPAEALFATRDGLSLIEKCFDQLTARMPSGGIAIFEADPRQWTAIKHYAHTHGFAQDATREFAVRFIKQ